MSRGWVLNLGAKQCLSATLVTHGLVTDVNVESTDFHMEINRHCMFDHTSCIMIDQCTWQQIDDVCTLLCVAIATKTCRVFILCPLRPGQPPLRRDLWSSLCQCKQLTGEMSVICLLFNSCVVGSLVKIFEFS